MDQIIYGDCLDWLLKSIWQQLLRIHSVNASSVVKCNKALKTTSPFNTVQTYKILRKLQKTHVSRSITASGWSPSQPLSHWPEQWSCRRHPSLLNLVCHNADVSFGLQTDATYASLGKHTPHTQTVHVRTQAPITHVAGCWEASGWPCKGNDWPFITVGLQRCVGQKIW